MAGSVNKVILVGHLGADPDVRTFANGGKVANIRIATSESWTDKQSGEKREKTEWHSISITSDGLVGVAQRYLKKGSKVYFEGKLQTRKWQDAQGNDRYSTEVVVSGFGGSLVMLDGPNAGARGGAAAQGGQQGGAQSGQSSGGDSGGWNQGGGDFDDDVPF